MKKRWKSLIVVLLLIAGIICVIVLNPLRRSEEHIRNRLLQELPLGTQLAEVKKYIEKKGWEISYVAENSGFLDQRNRPNTVVGEKSIRASLGDYQDIPFKANVTVFWGFDKDSRLIDVWVWKTWDAL